MPSRFQERFELDFDETYYGHEKLSMNLPSSITQIEQQGLFFNRRHRENSSSNSSLRSNSSNNNGILNWCRKQKSKIIKFRQNF